MTELFSVADAATLARVPGPATSFSVTASPGGLQADGVDTTKATASVRDANGNRIGGHDITISSSDSGQSVGPVTETATGYSATIRASKKHGAATITATNDTLGGLAATTTVQQFDVTTPTVTVTSPGEGAVFAQGSLAAVDFACADDPAWAPASRAARDPSPTAPRWKTTTVGTHILDFAAQYVAGNSTEWKVAYIVTPVIGPIPGPGGGAPPIVETPKAFKKKGKARLGRKGGKPLLVTGIDAACPATSTGPCDVIASVYTAGGGTARAAAAKRLGSAKFKLGAGKARGVSVPLSRSMAKVARKRKKLQVRLRLAPKGAAATTARVAVKVG